EWVRRYLAAGGRIRYLADAAVWHRRAGDDARLRSLARAAYARGRSARRFDTTRGEAPRLEGELRVLAGCLGHAALRRCANGLILGAHSAGRLREALAPRRAAWPTAPSTWPRRRPGRACGRSRGERCPCACSWSERTTPTSRP